MQVVNTPRDHIFALVVGEGRDAINKRLLAMLAGYFDGSGTRDNHGRYVVAGFVAACYTWADIAEKWATVLLEPPTIPHFRMADMRRLEWRQEHRITEEEAENKIKRLSSLVAPGQVLFSVVCSISLDEFADIVTNGRLLQHKDVRRVLGKLFVKNPYNYLFHRVVGLTIAHVHQLGIYGDQVDFVFDRENLLFDHAKGILDQIRPMMEPVDREYIGDAMQRSSYKVKPLQAADLIAARAKDQCNNPDDLILRRAISSLSGSGDENITLHLRESHLTELVEHLCAAALVGA